MHLLAVAIRVTACAAALLVGGCEVKKQPTDLTVRLSVANESKPAVVAALDRLTAERGWTKTAAAPGLDELAKRKVIFWSYGRGKKEMLLTITDITKESELEVRAYFEPSLPGVVEEVAARFSAEAQSIAGVTSVVQEPRQR